MTGLVLFVYPRRTPDLVFYRVRYRASVSGRRLSHHQPEARLFLRSRRTFASKSSLATYPG